MFKLVDTYRYWWPVIVKMPDQDKPGKMIEQQLKVLFESIDQDEALAAQEVYEQLTSVRDRIEHERAQLLKVVKGWDGVEAEDKKQIDFSEEMFRMAMQKPWFRTAVYLAHADSLIGREAAVGN